MPPSDSGADCTGNRSTARNAVAQRIKFPSLYREDDRARFLEGGGGGSERFPGRTDLLSDGGQAVNSYVEPLVSLDLDLVVAVDQIEAAENLLRARFDVTRFAHSLNVSSTGSKQVSAKPAYRDLSRQKVSGSV